MSISTELGNWIFLFLDQVRSNMAAFVAVLLFCHRAFLPRRNFGWRLGAGFFLCILQAAIWNPLYKQLTEDYAHYQVYGFLFLVVTGALIFLMILFCYEINIAQTLYRCILGKTTEVISNVLLRYLICKMWLPDLESKAVGLYCVVMLIVYLLVYLPAYQFFAAGMVQGARETFREQRVPVINILLFTYVGYWMLTAMTQAMFENVLLPFAEDETYGSNYRMIQYFCIGILLLISGMILVIMKYIYQIGILEQEQRLQRQLEQERASQYAFSKENADMINRKYHDLKHQLLALEQASGGERQEMLRQTRESVAFYDAHIETGNEALDTILTEKSMVCANRGIKISYNVSAENLDQIRLLDLYTLLGNALDNAIECVSALQDESKRTISVTVSNRGSMIYLATENYYEGTLQMKNGYPITNKKDKENHGFGVRSMEHIAKTYGGSMRITTNHQIFRLQLLLAP
jgi:hypothetical protein